MKKTVIIAVFAFLSMQMFAQFTLGPKLGYTASVLSTDIAQIKEEFSNTFHFGFFIRIGSKVYVQPEVLYMGKGGTLVGSLVNTETELRQTIELSTVDIPFLIGFSILQSRNKNSNIRIFAGPEISFFIDKEVVVNLSNLANVLKEADFADQQYGIQFGVGFDLSLISIDARYEIGFQNITNDEYSYNLNNRNFLITLGIKVL